MSDRSNQGTQQAERHAASAETGQRATARTPGASGVSSGLQPGGTLPSTEGLGGLGSVGTRGGSAPDATSGMSGQRTNDSDPHGGPAGEDPQAPQAGRKA